MFVEKFAEGLLARVIDTSDEELKGFLGLRNDQSQVRRYEIDELTAPILLIAW
jgi:hypothetical protein